MKCSKKKLLISFLCLLLCLITVISAFTVYYVNYYENATVESEFLPYPDAVTIYYNDNGQGRKKRLSKAEIKEVYEAFKELKIHFDYVPDAMYLIPQEWNKEDILTHAKSFGGIQFHYKQRRDFQAALFPKDSHELNSSQEAWYIKKEADSVLFTYNGENTLRMGSFWNSEYTDASIGVFTTEAVATFWAAVNACAE